MTIEILYRDVCGADADDSDREFRWSCGADPVSKVNEAFSYLQLSNAASALISFLKSDTSNRIYIFCTDDDSAFVAFYPREEVERNHIAGVFGSLVVWNPTRSLTVKNNRTTFAGITGRKHRGLLKPAGDPFNEQGHQSPAMGLIHELGHARQYLLKNDWFMGLYRQVQAHNRTAYYAIEEDNLRTVETVVARQLGEPIRWKYSDNNGTRPSRVINGEKNSPGPDPILAH